MKDFKLNIEYLPVKALKPYDKNARKHNKEDVSVIMKSIEKYGFSDPIGIWSDNNIIVEGHGRVEACKKLGIKEVPVIRLDHLTDEERRQYALMHNKTAELSSWDFDILSEELQDLDFGDLELDWGVESSSKSKKIIEGEVEFSEELLLTHNYIVLYFDNDFDWEVAQDKFGLKQVKDLIPRKGQPTGIGRVINGKRILEWKEN